MLGDDQQEAVQQRWMARTHDEFYESEVDSWRDSGQALEEAKRTLADDFNRMQEIPVWFTDALNEVRDIRDENGDAAIPYTDKQLFDALKIEEYESSSGEGRDDPDLSWDDKKLQEPIGGPSPDQMNLPGIKPAELSERLTEDMRSQLESVVIRTFNGKAESDAGDVDPPSYLNDSVEEYQGEYWDQMDDRQRLQYAIDYGMADIDLPPDEDEEPPQTEMELPKTKDDELLKLVRSDDPKSIWKIADSPRGKELLLNSGWRGRLNLKDPESYSRFKQYVGRVKKEKPRAIAA